MFFSPWRPQSPTNSILSDPKITPMPLNLLGSPARSWEKWAACSSVHRCIINQRALYPFLAPPSPLTTSARPSDRPARRPQRGRDENFHHFPPHNQQLNRVTLCSKQKGLRSGTHTACHRWPGAARGGGLHLRPMHRFACFCGIKRRWP